MTEQYSLGELICKLTFNYCTCKMKVCMKTILFMGDSITDAGRCRTDDHLLGNGYATMTAGKIGVGYPGVYQCINRGISGNRSIDIYARMNEDILDLKPDFISILMGVNDVWHGLEAGNGVSPEVYRQTIPCSWKKSVSNYRRRRLSLWNRTFNRAVVPTGI